MGTSQYDYRNSALWYHLAKYFNQVDLDILHWMAELAGNLGGWDVYVIPPYRDSSFPGHGAAPSTGPWCQIGATFATTEVAEMWYEEAYINNPSTKAFDPDIAEFNYPGPLTLENVMERARRKGVTVWNNRYSNDYLPMLIRRQEQYGSDPRARIRVIIHYRI